MLLFLLHIWGNTLSDNAITRDIACKHVTSCFLRLIKKFYKFAALIFDNICILNSILFHQQNEWNKKMLKVEKAVNVRKYVHNMTVKP